MRKREYALRNTEVSQRNGKTPANVESNHQIIKRFYNKGTNFYYEVIEMSLIKLLHFIFFLLDKLMKWLKGLKDLPAKKIEPKNSTFTTNTIFITNF